MNYTDIRDQIKTGDLIGFTHKEWDSWYDFKVQMVRLAQRSEYSHVAIAYVMNDRVFILEAVGAEVRLFPLSRELPFYWLKNPKKATQQAIDYGFSMLGLKYESQLMMALSFVFGFSLKHNKRMQCSELANNWYNANGQELTTIDTPTAVMQAALSKWPSMQFVE